MGALLPNSTPSWHLSNTQPSPSFVPLPKSQNPDRVRSNIDVFNFEISSEDIEKLDGLDRGKDGAVTWNPIDVD
jgi:diketogulonate reductase-like aldo/keto reductase